jgi:Chromo (CHRromatin Organisation MOdifier) domain
MRIHPVFHNTLLKPYKETPAHGPNFTRPPPEIVGGEEGHYEIERILASRPTRNKRSTQYLVKWKGYPDSDNSWLPAKELAHAQDLVKQFQNHQIKTLTAQQALQAQWKPKEGILSQAKPASPYPKKGSHDLSHDRSCDSSPDRSHDLSRDQLYKLSRDRLHNPSCDQTRPRDHTRFGRATKPLVGIWKTVGRT